ncbi:MAG: ROK family protein, partial [Ruminococcus sp.]
SYMLNSVGGDINQVNGKTPFDAMLAGDFTGKAVIDEYVSYLACGIVNVINIFQPDVLCVGGGVSKQGETLLGPVRAIVEQERITKHNDKQTVICAATLGNDAGIIGAACL